MATNFKESTATRSGFTDWIFAADGSAFQCEAGSYHVTVIRVRKNDDFDYLYCQRNYRGSGIVRSENFEYAGICRKLDGMIFDTLYNIQDVWNNEGRSREALHENLKRTVREAVEVAVNNDRRSLAVTEITDERQRESLTHFEKYAAAGNARAAYLSGEHDTFTFQCRYNPERWTEDSLLEYLLNPAEYAAKEVATYMDTHQEDMLSDFLAADMVAAEYAKILENPLNPIHRVKRIMAAVDACSAKTVTVTVCIDDIDFTFKADAGQFRRDCTDSYSGYHIAAAADRQEGTFDFL